MAAFTHHDFVRGDARAAGHPRGCCDPGGKRALREVFRREPSRAGLDATVRANHAGCLDQCEHGPTVVIDPQGIWYGRVQVEDLPRIVERTIVGGEVISELQVADDRLNNPDRPHRAPWAASETRP